MFNKIVHKKSWSALVFVSLLTCFPSSTWAYYCAFGTKNNFIQVGDTIERVRQQCGSPNRVEVCQHTVANSVNNNKQASNSTLINGVNIVTTQTNSPSTAKQITQNIDVTVWSYDQGQNLPELLFEFHNGRLHQAPLPNTQDACAGNNNNLVSD